MFIYVQLNVTAIFTNKSNIFEKLHILLITLRADGPTGSWFLFVEIV